MKNRITGLLFSLLTSLSFGDVDSFESALSKTPTSEELIDSEADVIYRFYFYEDAKESELRCYTFYLFSPKRDESKLQEAFIEGLVFPQSGEISKSGSGSEISTNLFNKDIVELVEVIAESEIFSLPEKQGPEQPKRHLGGNYLVAERATKNTYLIRERKTNESAPARFIFEYLNNLRI